MLGQPVIPDYVRFGSQLYYVTWPRLVIICVSALLLIMGVSELQEHLPVESDLAADKAGVLGSGDPPRYSGDGGGIRGLLGKAASRLTAGHGAGKSGKAGKAAKPGAPAALPSVMPSWCASKGSLYYLDKWKLAYIGRDSHYPDTDPGNPAAAAPAEPAKDPGGQLLCDWVPISKVKVCVATTQSSAPETHRNRFVCAVVAQQSGGPPPLLPTWYSPLQRTCPSLMHRARRPYESM